MLHTPGQDVTKETMHEEPSVSLEEMIDPPQPTSSFSILELNSHFFFFFSLLWEEHEVMGFKWFPLLGIYRQELPSEPASTMAHQFSPFIFCFLCPPVFPNSPCDFVSDLTVT